MNIYLKSERYSFFFKILLLMKALLLLFCLSVVQATTLVHGQKITLILKSVSVEQALVAISKHAKHDLVYDSNLLKNQQQVNLNLQNVSLTTALSQLFENKPFNYEVEKNTIVVKNISAKESRKTSELTIIQTKNLTGVVTDAGGNPISGVTVTIKGTNTGTMTNERGIYSLTALTEARTIVFSMVGYESKEIQLANKTVISVDLTEVVDDLEEVVVVGYGTQRKADVTGSIATVSGDKLKNLPTAGAEEALQGMAPGLSVNFGSGSPGTSPAMMIRGVTSWGSSNDPLVIIDGVPGDLSFVNPEDIKTVSVLKDAALAAIYGARSAAGVILVETNRGANQEPKMSFSAFYGIDDLPKRMSVANSAEYIKINKMALENAGIAKNRWPKYIDAYEQNPLDFADTDWQDEYYRRGSTSKYSLGYVAGGENSNIAFSGYYSKIKGVVSDTDAEKYGVRINSDVKRGKFEIGESFSYGKKTNRPEENSGFPGMYQTTNIQPLIHVYDENNEGGFGGAIPGLGMTDAANPVAINRLVDTENGSDYLSGSGYIAYKPIDGLIFRFRASRSIDFGHYKSFRPTYYVGANSINTLASLSETRSKLIDDLLELTGTYSTVVKDKHNIDGLLGVSQEESQFDDQLGSVSKFDNNNMPYLVHGQENAMVKGGAMRNALRSAFGRVNYNYDYKYMAMFSARYDGSSRFAKGNQWGFFPSMSLGWNIANETFWEDIKGHVHTLKLRASYGNLGNQSIGNYMYIPSLTYNTNALNYPFGGNTTSLGYAITGLPSSNIKWETTTYKNIALDVGLLNNRLDITLEAFIKDTYDMLTSKNVSLATGFGPLIVNEGKLKTKGLELQASYRGGQSDFKYNLDLNLSHYKSVLKEMPDPGYLYESGPARTYVGGEIGEFWVWRTAGIFQNQVEVDDWNRENGSVDAAGGWIPLQPAAKPGDIRFIDQNNDGKLDSYDRVYVGSGTPKVALGFNVNLSYKSFDLMANFYGNFGAKRYNYMKRQLQRMDNNFNYGKDALNAWTPENPNTDIPRAVIGDPNGNSRTSDRFVENGNYLRLNNLQVGYNLPRNLREKFNMADFRIYAGATRLFTITNYKGYDPSTGAENGLMGVDDALYPLSRTFMLGVKVGF